MLPTVVRTTAQALAEVLVFDLPPTRTAPNQAALITASVAAYRGEQINLHYRAFNGEASERVVDPYSVAYRAGFWYLVGYCHLRQDLRTFRLERVVSVTRLVDSAFVRPQEFDVLAFVEASIANTPGVWSVEVRLDTTLETAQQLIPRALGLPLQQGEAVILRCHVQDLNWFAYFLTQLDCPAQVISPPEARTAIRAWADRIAQVAHEDVNDAGNTAAGNTAVDES